MEERLGYLVAQLAAAIADFERALTIDTQKLDPPVADAVQSGQAQKFEFTIELFWKTVKRFLLEEHGFDIASPKPTVKKYFELGYVDYAEAELLLKAIDMRNALSHVYRKEQFAVLYADICRYRGVFGKAAVGMMERRGEAPPPQNE